MSSAAKDGGARNRPARRAAPHRAEKQGGGEMKRIGPVSCLAFLFRVSEVRPEGSDNPDRQARNEGEEQS